MIERTENFAKNRKFDKIICIDPQVRIMSDDETINLAKTEKFNALLKKEISKNARRNNIKLEIQALDSKADALYYNDLLSLKRDLLQANNYQDSPLNSMFGFADNAIQRKVFVYPPLISHDFVNYSQKFGTPYFSYIGLYQKKDRVLLYHLIVNTETAETVYRELKGVGASLNSTTVAQAIYDSFAMISSELK
jgi:hypothetical protein